MMTDALLSYRVRVDLVRVGANCGAGPNNSQRLHSFSVIRFSMSKNLNFGEVSNSFSHAAEGWGKRGWGKKSCAAKCSESKSFNLFQLFKKHQAALNCSDSGESYSIRDQVVSTTRSVFFTRARMGSF